MVIAAAMQTRTSTPSEKDATVNELVSAALPTMMVFSTETTTTAPVRVSVVEVCVVVVVVLGTIFRTLPAIAGTA
jgi:hypothetical protein